MPFTLSHAVAIVPFARGGPGRWLVPAGLVIGSWVPDLPYFIPFPLNSDATHAASGPVTIDLLLGLVVFALWEFVLRRPLADLAPEALSERLPAPAPLDWLRWGSAAVAVVLGAVTHVVWDTFSHPGRWGTTHLSVLQISLAGLPLFKWVQYGSGGLGLAGLAIWLVLWIRRTEGQARTPRCSYRSRIAVYTVLVGTIASAISTAAVLQHRGRPRWSPRWSEWSQRQQQLSRGL